MRQTGTEIEGGERVRQTDRQRDRRWRESETDRQTQR